MNRQLRAGRPSLLLANRDPADTEEQAYEKALAEIESGPLPEFSGYRLHQRDPRKYALACRLISEGLATSRIARALAISPHTVQAVRLRENVPVELEKGRLCDLARSTSRLCLERLAEMVPEMAPRDLAIAAGICIDKAALLANEPTSINLNKGEQLSHLDFNTLLSQLPQADARVISDSAGEVNKQ
jgi:hypothetical protein